MKRLAEFALIFLLGCGASGAAQTKPKAALSKPSLDLLMNRVDGYWKALLAGNRARAAGYVTFSERSNFRSGNTPPFRDPSFKSLELSSDRTEATVIVIVKRIVPPVTAEMDWPVTEHWRFENSNWYKRYDPPHMPIAGLTRPPSATQIDAARRALLKRIQFEKKAFDFGNVNQGKDVVLAVRYTLAGSNPIPLAFRTSAPGSNCPECDRERGISLRGPQDQSLLPGNRRELSVEVPTWNFDGAVKETFTLIARSKDVDVPFEFSVHGNVYTPLSILPKVLKLKKGEREKEIMMRNNSKLDIQLEKVISETTAISIEPFPVVIPPGQELKFTLKAEESLDSAVPNSVDRMAITYGPVDGFSAISYRVYLNSSEDAQEKPAAPVNEKEIQELMKENRPFLPNR
jgi:hypothetical protein